MNNKTETLENIREWVWEFSREFKSLAFVKKHPNVNKVFDRGMKSEVNAILTIMEGSTYTEGESEIAKYWKLTNANIALRLGHKKPEETNRVLNLMVLTGLIYKGDSGWRITVWDDDKLERFAQRVSAVAEMEYLKEVLDEEWVSN